MSHEHFKGLSIFSSIIVIAGLVLMFSSIYLGISFGDSWLFRQENGIADTSQYNMIVETYKNNFVIMGSILFGVGVLSAIFTYYTYVLFRKVENKNTA
ncbi:hypothetical protein ACQCT6_11095 [Cytobacillus gottheilii]|uniref:hypothetical protein n=1 Tax=Cytobacillus gottheilii TaxID=859144 RepID=UPI003CEC0BAD